MTANKYEHLSALVDDEAGEFEGRRLVEELSKNAEVRARWARYHLIGEAMRGGLPPRLAPDLAARVSRALEAEPPLRRPSSRWTPRLLKPVVGFALAAGVAVVSVLSLQSFTDRSDPVAPARLAASTGGAAPVTRVAVEDGASVPPGIARVAAQTEPAPSVPPAELSARLNSYLVNHAEYAPSSPGILPQVRVVGYAQNQD